MHKGHYAILDNGCKRCSAGCIVITLQSYSCLPSNHPGPASRYGLADHLPMLLLCREWSKGVADALTAGTGTATCIKLSRDSVLHFCLLMFC